MSYITPARRMGRLPLQFFTRLVATTQALQQAGHDVNKPVRHVAAAPATHKYIAFGGLKVLQEAATRFCARHNQVALDPETETCILIGAKLGLQEISLCLLNEGDFCLMPDPGYPDDWSDVALAGATAFGPI